MKKKSPVKFHSMNVQPRGSNMWWNRPLLKDFARVFPDNIVDIVARSYAIVEVGGLSGCGPERGRRFERLFYNLCDRRGVHLSEKSGSTSLAEQRSASGLRHEIDGATRAVNCVTQWELKHLTTKLEKNELLVFNSKSLDFLQGSNSFYAKTPLYRFLLSGFNIRDECRYFSVLWGITVVEPSRLPLPLLCEAVARGAAMCLSQADCVAVRDLAIWSCRPLQRVLKELTLWVDDSDETVRCGPRAIRAAKAATDLQEQIGLDVLDYLDEHFPDWIDETAEETWQEVGGW